ncbi:MAG TPA: site-2 protease family protein [Verrucomicrobiae bacterium]
MFYKHDSTRITLREFGFDGKMFPVLVGALGKVLRYRLPSSTDDVPVEAVGRFEVPEESVPAEIRAAFEPMRRELEGLGFHSPVFHAISHQFTFTQYYWATFIHSSGQSIARIHYRHWTQAVPARTHLFAMFASMFTDGTWLVSTAGKPDMLAPPQVQELRVVGASPGVLWQAFSAELGRMRATKTPYAISTQEHLRNAVENWHVALRDFHLKRGVFVPLSPVDHQHVSILEQVRAQAASTGSAHPEVHAQIEALQRKQSSWSSAILLLVVSIAFFVGLGSARWDWKFVLLLVPVLLFHELGHYVAMRLFNYRNLRMFFIPLLGAAVSGSNYNVPGWKKVIVSLAGPVPGILAAIPLGAAGYFLGHEWMTKLAVLMVVLNGFNLLPILPLDGGWVMHTLFFSRHYALDFAFRIIAIVGMLAVSASFGDKFLMYLAIFMAIGLPVSWKLARISTQLRREQLPQASADNQTIPLFTAERIIGEVKKAFPKGATPKNVAEHTLQVFETLNARPPGWFATIFYGGVHVGSIVAAFFLWGFLTIGQAGGLEKFLAQEFARPENVIECGLVEMTTKESQLTATQTLVAIFDDKEKATTAYNEVIGQLTSDKASARLFGQTLMVGFFNEPGALKDELIQKIEPQSTNLFVQSSNYNATFTLWCRASDEASGAEIKEELQETFNSARMKTVPVWIPNNPIEPKRWEEIRNARRTYAKLQETASAGYTNAEVRKFGQQMMKAQRRGDLDLVKKLEEEQTTARKKIQQAALDAVATESGTDPEVVRLYRAYPDLIEDFEDEKKMEEYSKARKAIDEKLAERFGKIELRDGKPAQEVARYTASWGSAEVEKDMIKLQWVSFENLFHGPPALLDWLCARGCKEFLYRFNSPGATGDDEEDVMDRF